MEAGSPALIDKIQQSCVGHDRVVTTPYGARRLTYADYAASGRALSFIEDFIRQEVLPLYGNTHTEASATALQTTRFREDARRVIAQAVGAGPDSCVLFTGAGTTSAVTKMITALGIRLPDSLDSRYNLARHIPDDQRPVVFIGPYEHHSNELPWRETIADVVVISPTPKGLIDLECLARALVKYRRRPLKIGSFSAASNVTGIVSDTDAITALLHKHGALSFWDYAAGGPHLKVEMGHKDAVFLSPHKYPGGPGTPGVLVVRNALMRIRCPTVPGGGTVDLVSPWTHAYTSDIVHREEGGTPAIIESIRCGLVFQLKSTIPHHIVADREQAIIQRAFAAWSAEPSIQILGDLNVARVPIISFLVRSGAPTPPGGTARSGGDKTGYLHHNFVVALLNDIFGIQTRGGCSCAGPYGHALLDVNQQTSEAFHTVVRERAQLGIKPGWCRVTFKFFMPDEVVEYIIRAVLLVAKYGWALLLQYIFDPATGLWTHRQGSAAQPLSLNDLSYTSDGVLSWAPRQHSLRLTALQEHMRDGEAILTSAHAAALTPSTGPMEMVSVNTDFDALRWFDLPKECLLPATASSPRSAISCSPTLYDGPSEMSSPQTSPAISSETQRPCLLSPGTALIKVVNPAEVVAAAGVTAPQLLSMSAAHDEYRVAGSNGLDARNKPKGKARRKLGLLSLFNHHDHAATNPRHLTSA